MNFLKICSRSLMVFVFFSSPLQAAGSLIITSVSGQAVVASAAGNNQLVQPTYYIAKAQLDGVPVTGAFDLVFTNVLSNGSAAFMDPNASDCGSYLTGLIGNVAHGFYAIVNFDALDIQPNNPPQRPLYSVHMTSCGKQSL